MPPSEGGPGWNESANAANNDLMAAALEDMQVKMSKLDLDNARLRVDLVRPATLSQDLQLVPLQAENVTLLHTQAAYPANCIR